MTWIILYILIASVAVFGLCYVRQHIGQRSWSDDLVVPVICGVLWPVCAPIYGAYLAAVWYSGKE